MKKTITSSSAPAPIGPYSHAVSSNGLLFVSGQVAKKASGELILDNIKAETKVVMENISAILKEAGLDFSNVVKTTIFLTDMNNFQQVNEVYGSFFKEQAGYPARETVQVSKLPLNVNVEISVIAAA